MTLTQEQIKKLKQHLSKQIQHLPLEQKKQAQSQIDSMSPQALETMLKQEQAQSPFRAIVSKKLPSTILEENEDAIAVLEINPISEGHTLIIPKKQITDKNKVPQTIKKFTEKISSQIQSSLEAKKIHSISELKFGEIIIDIIPEYTSPISLQSKRKKTSPQALEKLAEKIKKPIIKIENKVKKIKTPLKKTEKITKSRRIP